MANNWVKYEHSNYPAGGPESADYLADADEFNQNYEDICDAVGARYVRGTACVDKNSDSTTCEVWLAADGGERDVCDSGWYALIYYGASNVWETTVSVSGSDCYIVFGDAELENPATSGISDYSAAAFIDSLHILLFPKKMKLPADWLITTDEANGALTTGDIFHDGTALSTFVGDIKDRVDVALDSSGNLNAGVVDSTSIAGDTAVMADSAVNLLAGGSLEHYGDRHDLLFRVEITPDASAATYEIVTAAEHTDGSARAQKVVAGGSNQGILLDLSPNFADKILVGKYVAASFRVKTSVEDSLEIGFLEDTTSYSGSTPDISAGTWTTVTVSKQISANKSQVRAYVRANQACEFYVARAQANIGDKAFGFSISPYEDTARILMDTTQDNLLFNGGFERWTVTDGTVPPDGWFVVGSPDFSDPAGDPNPAGTGNKLCELTLDANDGMGQYLGLVTGDSTTSMVNESILVGLVRGSKVCASVDLMLDATATTGDKVTLVLGDSDGTNVEEEDFEVKPLGTEMRRFTIYKDIQTDAKRVYFKILNETAEQVVVNVDNAMLHVGEFPLKFKPSAGWREMRWDFGYDGTASDGDYMSAEGVGGGGVIADAPEYPMPGEAGAYLMLKAAARCLTAPDTDVTWTVSVDSTNYTEIYVEIKGSVGEKEGANHVTDYTDNDHECTSYIKAPVYNSGGAMINCVHTTFSVWGYYYAS